MRLRARSRPRPPSAREIAAAIARSRETEPERWAPFTDIDRARADRIARYRVAKEYSARVATTQVFAFEAYAEDTRSLQPNSPIHRIPMINRGIAMGGGQGWAVRDPPVPACAECLASCPGSSQADPCFCRCLKEAGGCGQTPRVLDLCVENDPKKLKQLLNSNSMPGSYGY